MLEIAAEGRDADHGASETEARHDAIELLAHALDEWRARIDQLLVQVDLASLDIRDGVRKSIDTTENLYLTARLALSDARNDAGASLDSVRKGLEQLLGDLGMAYERAEGVVLHSREK